MVGSVCEMIELIEGEPHALKKKNRAKNEYFKKEHPDEFSIVMCSIHLFIYLVFFFPSKSKYIFVENGAEKGGQQHSRCKRTMIGM